MSTLLASLSIPTAVLSSGICFGHQIVARALGGSCVPNDGKWEVGITDVSLTDVGRRIFKTDKMVCTLNPNVGDKVQIKCLTEHPTNAP